MPEAPFDLRVSRDGGLLARARGTITPETLVIESIDPPGPRLTIDWADVESARIGQVEVDLTLEDGARYRLSHLATRFDPFAAAFSAARNERWIRGLLYRDETLQREFRGEAEREIDGALMRDKAVLRLYPSSLAALCAASDPFSISFNDLRTISFDPAAYAVRLGVESGAVVSVYKLGDRFDEFQAYLEGLRDEMFARVAAALQQIVPALGDAGSLARMVGHGRPFNRAEADAASPGAWDLLTEAVLGTVELEQTYRRLTRDADPGLVYLGLAAQAEPEPETAVTPEEGTTTKEAAAEETPTTAEAPGADAAQAESERKPYVSWFLVALPPQRRLAMEVTNEPGHATYLFRLDPSEPDREARRLGQAMVALNFAREPIYLPEERLSAGVRRRYRLALRKLPYLKRVREQFVGRAIHDATWEKQVDRLLGGD